MVSDVPTVLGQESQINTTYWSPCNLGCPQLHTKTKSSRYSSQVFFSPKEITSIEIRMILISLGFQQRCTTGKSRPSRTDAMLEERLKITKNPLKNIPKKSVKILGHHVAPAFVAR